MAKKHGLPVAPSLRASGVGKAVARLSHTSEFVLVQWPNLAAQSSLSLVALALKSRHVGP